MSGGARQDLHQFDRRCKKPGQSLRRDVDRQALAKMRFLRCNSDRAIIGMASTHAETADRLDSCVRDSDSVGAQRHGFGEVRRVPQAARRDQCHVG